MIFFKHSNFVLRSSVCRQVHDLYIQGNIYMHDMVKKCYTDNNLNENVHGLMCHCIHSCCVIQYHITVQDDDGGDYCYIITCASNQ